MGSATLRLKIPHIVQTHKTPCFHGPTYVRAHKTRPDPPTTCFHVQCTSKPTKPRVCTVQCKSRLGGLRPPPDPPRPTRSHKTTAQRRSKLGGLRPPRPPRPPLVRVCKTMGLWRTLLGARKLLAGRWAARPESRPRNGTHCDRIQRHVRAQKVQVFRIKCKSRLGGLRPPRPPRHTRSHKTTVQRRSRSKLYHFLSL